MIFLTGCAGDGAPPCSFRKQFVPFPERATGTDAENIRLCGAMNAYQADGIQASRNAGIVRTVCAG